MGKNRTRKLEKKHTNTKLEVENTFRTQAKKWIDRWNENGCCYYSAAANIHIIYRFYDNAFGENCEFYVSVLLGRLVRWKNVQFNAFTTDSPRTQTHSMRLGRKDVIQHFSQCRSKCIWIYLCIFSPVLTTTERKKGER